MKLLQCIIIDDEPLARGVIAEYVAQIDFLRLIGQAKNAIEANSLLIHHQVDLIFLDIQMPKISGLEFLKQLPRKPLVILTTAFPEYALQGYEFDVVDYLLKPIALPRFIQAVNKAAQRSNIAQSHPIETVDQAVSTQPFVYLKGADKMTKFLLADILYLESVGHYVKVFTTNGSVLVHESISALEEKLPSTLFLRIHRSFMVNTQNILAYSNNLIEVGEYQVPIGRKYKPLVKEVLEG
ncbi:MAG: LytR/AlgR family response regulator transcription factor [Flammeovirgaceae bacterium]